MIIQLTATLETSFHDGYCTDNECEYSCEKGQELVTIDDIDVFASIFQNGPSALEQFLRTPHLYCGKNSFYCKNSQESIQHGVEQHEYKYTINAIHVVKITKFQLISLITKLTKFIKK